MKKPEILVISPLQSDQMDQLEARYTLHRHDEADHPDFFLKEVAAKITGMVTTGGWSLSRDIVESLPNLEIVSSFGVGYEAIDIAACTQNRVVVANTPDVLTDDVADLALGLILATQRDIVRGDSYVRSGDWGRKGMYPLKSTLKGKRVGIVGLGRIGGAIASRCLPMGVEIGYTARSRRDGSAFHFESDALSLAKWSNILVVVVPGGAETEGLISGEVLHALGPEGTLINVSRGTVVDERALIDALESGRLGCAGLDVFKEEPNPDPELVRLPNTVLHPHHASGTVETRNAMAQLVVDNLDAHYAGEPVLTPVNPGAQRFCGTIP